MVRTKPRLRLAVVGSHVVLLLATALSIFPLIWMIGISVTPASQISGAALRPIPLTPTIENYVRAIEASNIPLQFVNSIIFAGGVTLGLLAVSIPAAYAIARWRFRGSQLFVAALIVGLSVPFVVTYLPNFLFVSKAGLINTYPGLILPQIASAYGVLLLTQHFRSFPREIIEASQIDGAGPGRALISIILPTLRAPILAVALFVFITTWNELVWPQLIASATNMQVLANGLTQFASLEGGVSYGPLMAAATLTAAPTVILFLVFRKRILAVALDGGIR